MLFNALGSHSYGAFRGGRSGLCPCSVAYPRWTTCPFDCLIRARVQRLNIACEIRWGQPVAGALSRHTTPSMSESSVTWLGGFKRAGRCAALCRSDSTPSGVSIPVQVCQVVVAQGKRGKRKVFGVTACLTNFFPPSNRTDTQSRYAVRCEWQPDQAPNRCVRRHSYQSQASTSDMCGQGPRSDEGSKTMDSSVYGSAGSGGRPCAILPALECVSRRLGALPIRAPQCLAPGRLPPIAF